MYKVIKDFFDKEIGKKYVIGDAYKETSPERTAALLVAKKSEHNTVGKQFIQKIKKTKPKVKKV